MKICKKSLTIFMLIVTLATVMLFSSCDLFKSKVERKLEKLVNANSFTIEIVQDGLTKTVMIDTEKLQAYIRCEGASETYYYYDEETDKYYVVDIYYEGNDKEITKIELEKHKFIAVFEECMQYRSPYFENLITLDLWDEEDGQYTLVEEDEYGKEEITIWYEDDKLMLKTEDSYFIGTTNGDFSKDTMKIQYSAFDINKTDIEIPEEILNMNAKQ